MRLNSLFAKLANQLTRQHPHVLSLWVTFPCTFFFLLLNGFSHFVGCFYDIHVIENGPMATFPFFSPNSAKPFSCKMHTSLAYILSFINEIKTLFASQHTYRYLQKLIHE